MFAKIRKLFSFQLDHDKSMIISGYTSRVLETQITRLIESSGFNNIAGFVMAIIWVGLLWSDLPHVVLSVWLGVMAMLFIFRAGVGYFHLYEKNNFFIHLPVEIARRWYLVAVFVTGAGWGITATLMFPYEQIEQIVLAFILVGVAASGVTYSHVSWVYFGYVGFALVPLIIRLFYIGGEVYYALSAMTAFFLGVMMMAASRMNKASIDTLYLTYKNEELIQNLTRARNDLENLNQNLIDEISHVKQMEVELKQEKDRAEKMSRAKGEFLANMSHEIRTPMNGIVGTMQLLEETQLNETQNEYVKIACKSADSLLAILNDILDLSKIEAGKMSLEKIPFEWNEMVTDLVVLHSLKAEQQGVELTSIIDERLPKLGLGDPTRIRQILVNLISNALKFTRQGKVTVHVNVISIEQDECVVKIEVRDTGIGIPHNVQQYLFNAFTQADGSTTRKYGGTGLGLAIVKELVEMMDGHLGVESEEGKGSVFWFVLPTGISRSMLKEHKKRDNKSDEPVTGKVLLVEDNPINQMVAEKMLESIGLKSVLAANGREALDMLEMVEVDAVLMDCQMPEMDGFEATRILRQREHKKGKRGIPVIAMTANVMEGDRERCIEAGMDDYIGKPVKKEELRSIMRHWLT